MFHASTPLKKLPPRRSLIDSFWRFLWQNLKVKTLHPPEKGQLARERAIGGWMRIAVSTYGRDLKNSTNLEHQQTWKSLPSCFVFKTPPTCCCCLDFWWEKDIWMEKMPGYSSIIDDMMIYLNLPSWPFVGWKRSLKIEEKLGDLPSMRGARMCHCIQGVLGKSDRFHG